MAEFNYKPVNTYLPPRPRRDAATAAGARPVAEAIGPAGASSIEKFFAWADKVLSR